MKFSCLVSGDQLKAYNNVPQELAKYVDVIKKELNEKNNIFLKELKEIKETFKGVIKNNYIKEEIEIDVR